MSNPNKNASGCSDPTASVAIKNTSMDQRKVSKVVDLIKTLADLAGYELDSRLVLRDKETGKVWK